MPKEIIDLVHDIAVICRTKKLGLTFPYHSGKEMSEIMNGLIVPGQEVN